MFEVPRSFREELSDMSVREKDINLHAPNKVRPIISDPTRAKHQYGLRKEQIKILEKQIINGNGKNGK